MQESNDQPPGHDLESRMTAVEREIVHLRNEVALAASDARAARVLATGADRDVSDVRVQLRAHTSVLNAVRETQIEHGNAIAGLQAEMRTRFATVDAEMRAGFATVAAGMRVITERLDHLIGRDQS